MMRRLLLIATLALSACGGGDIAYVAPAAQDTAVHYAIRNYIASQGGPPNTQFQYVLEDMNGDGADDIVALFTLPYNYWCGLSGCTMAVLAADGGGYMPISQIDSVHGPIVLTTRSTYGWRDIAMRASGTSLRDRDVAMRFNGQTYPNNPTGQADLGESIHGIPGRRIFP